MKISVTKLLWVSICCWACCLHAETDQASTEMTEDDLLEATYSRLQVFNQELDWFISYTENCTNLSKEPSEKKSKEETLRIKQLKNELQDMQKIFLNLRRKMCDIILSKYGSYPYANSVCISTIDETTNWYTNYVEDLLFPRDWKSLFEIYQLEKKKVSDPVDPIKGLHKNPP